MHHLNFAFQWRCRARPEARDLVLFHLNDVYHEYKLFLALLLGETKKLFGNHRTLCRLSPMRGKGAGTSGVEQPKDEQLPERDCRPVRHHQKADIPHGTAHIRHNGDAGQQRADRNCLKNAGAYRYQDHPTLCQAAGHADRQRHGGLTETACQNATENYSYFYLCTTKQNNEAKRRLLMERDFGRRF